METLNPSAYFLRVSDKFFGEFICRDNAVSAGPALLYLLLFRKAYKGGLCRSSQFALARVCKCSVRSIQHYLRALAALKYISIEQQEDGRNVYRLLLSQRVLFFIAQERSATDDDDDGNDQGEEFSSGHAKNLRMGGENSSPIYKSDKSINTPLSPHLPEKRESTPSARKPFPSTTTVPNPQAGGWGDSFSRGKKPGKASGFQTANSLFERFFAAYPRKEAREPARAVWHQLWRRGALPALDHLLAALDHFRASTGWIREHGRFVPYLVNWLRGRRWEDEAGAPGASSSGVQSTPPSGTPSPTPDQQPIPRIAAFTPPAALETPEGKIFQKDYGLAVTELHALWPTASRNSIRSGLLLARLRGFGLKDLVARAREYARGNVLPRLSLGDWIKQEAFA